MRWVKGGAKIKLAEGVGTEPGITQSAFISGTASEEMKDAVVHQGAAQMMSWISLAVSSAFVSTIACTGRTWTTAL